MRCCVVLAALLVIALCADETVKHGVPGHKQRDAEHYQGGEHDDRFDHEAVLGKRNGSIIRQCQKRMFCVAFDSSRGPRSVTTFLSLYPSRALKGVFTL